MNIIAFFGKKATKMIGDYLVCSAAKNFGEDYLSLPKGNLVIDKVSEECFCDLVYISVCLVLAKHGGKKLTADHIFEQTDTEHEQTEKLTCGSTPFSFNVWFKPCSISNSDYAFTIT